MGDRYGITDPIWESDKIVGYQIRLSPRYDDYVVTLAHELFHAAAGSAGNYSAFKYTLGGAIHQEAFRRQNEVAKAYGHRIELYDGRNNEIEDPLKYVIR